MGPHRHAAALVAVPVIRRLLAASLLVCGVAAADEDGPVRLSLATESDRAAWRSPGFRIQLGAGYGRLFGLGGAPSGRLLGPVLRVGLRLDERWSLMGSFQYLSASADGGLSGLRFTGTVEPTLHLGNGFSVAVGFGFGGIVEGGNTGRVDPRPFGRELTDSYTFPDASTPLPTCAGVGVLGRARAEWMLLLGPRSSTGLALEVDGQWTGCVDDTGRVQDDTAEPIVRRQFWPHLGVTLSWLVSWR